MSISGRLCNKAINRDNKYSSIMPKVMTFIKITADKNPSVVSFPKRALVSLLITVNQYHLKC
jgi:hypothetical protein